MNETIENNKLIAEFMGATMKMVDLHEFTDEEPLIAEEWSRPDWFNERAYATYGWVSYQDARYMQYHSSWDWLMPVVEKIESLKYSIRMCAEPWFDDETGVDRSRTQNICIISNWSYQIVINSSGWGYDRDRGKLHSVYGAVVEFIKWYNEKNN